MIYANIIFKQVLCRTEIEGNYVCPNRTENNNLNLSYLKYVWGLIKNKTYEDV